MCGSWVWEYAEIKAGDNNTPRSSGPSAAARSEASTESVSDVRPGLTNTPVSSGRGAGARSGFGCTASSEGMEYCCGIVGDIFLYNKVG